jgi:hypothetical protein
VEALGARDHWAVECAAAEPVGQPDVTRALAALRQHTKARGLALPPGCPDPSTSNPPAAAA